MWARVRLDVGWSDLAFGLAQCLDPRPRPGLREFATRHCAPDGRALICFSVRSGFDLALQALDLPAGSEILFSALNIKGMPNIARRLGLVPVPLDLEPVSLLPPPAALERALTPRTRAVVVAPLFGTRGELSPLFALARRHGLRVIEDAAQAFAGREWTGHPEADVTLFSFGPLKFATALGGALAHVRDPALLARMREIEAGYPVLSHAAYMLRLLKFAGLKLVTTRPLLGVLTGALRLAGRDYEDAVTEPLRGVASLRSADAIRRRCPTALLALLERRVLAFGPERLAPRVAAGRRLLALLEDAVTCPAAGAAIHHFWVFPILVEDPPAVMRALRRAGFDASTLRRSAAVAPPPDRPELDPRIARETLAHLLVLPCHEGMPERELRRQAAVLRRACTASACNPGLRCA